MLTHETLTATKDKEAFKLIKILLEELPDNVPFPSLVRGLLKEDPTIRYSACEALESPLFQKFHMEIPTPKVLDVNIALPLDYDDEAHEIKDTKEQKKHKSKILKRKQTIQKLCDFMNCQHPLTPQSAYVYCQQMYQLDDTLDNIKESQIMHDCVLLACKFYEVELWNGRELQEENYGEKGSLFENWTLDEYEDNEATIWMLMDYCLYPRTLMQ